MAIRIFQHYWQLPLALLAAAEVILFFLSPYAAVMLNTGAGWRDIGGLDGPVLPKAVLFASAMFISMTAMGLYNARQRSRLAGLLTRVAASVGAGATFSAIVFYFFPSIVLYRGQLLITAALAFGAAMIVRVAFDRLLDENIFKRRVLVYGSGRRAGSIARLRRRSDRRGFIVVGYVAAEGEESSAVPSEEKMGGGDLLGVCRKHQVDEIVVAMDDRRRLFPDGRAARVPARRPGNRRADQLSGARDRQGAPGCAQSKLDDLL